MLGRIVTDQRSKNWSQAFFELLVVAVGILMAFQVDRWWEARHERETEQQYIDRLIGDLESDVENLEGGVVAAEFRLSLARLLMDVAESPELATQSPVDFVIAIEQAAFTYTPALTSNTFDELRSTGNLRLLRDAGLKNSLFDYYRFDESQRQFQSLQLMQEIRHFEFGAGVLTNKQHRQAHDDWGVVSAGEIVEFRNDTVDLVAVRAAAERLLANERFVTWLPIAHQMQMELANINRERQRRANVLLDILRSLQNGGQSSG
jgi:hypothetical protein